jgi:hypothetical protein
MNDQLIDQIYNKNDQRTDRKHIFIKCLINNIGKGSSTYPDHSFSFIHPGNFAEFVTGKP